MAESLIVGGGLCFPAVSLRCLCLLVCLCVATVTPPPPSLVLDGAKKQPKNKKKSRVNVTIMYQIDVLVSDAELWRFSPCCYLCLILNAALWMEALCPSISGISDLQRRRWKGHLWRWCWADACLHGWLKLTHPWLTFRLTWLTQCNAKPMLTLFSSINDRHIPWR